MQPTKFYDQQVQMYTRKIKMMEDNPDPTHLKSYKMFYELERDLAQERIDALKEGKPLIEGHHANNSFYRSMGFTSISFPSTVEDAESYSDYQAILARMGFPEKCCERAHAQLAMCEAGNLPLPHVVFN